MSRKQRPSKDYTRTCGHCALCLHTNLGCICNLTDQAVDYGADGCVDFIKEEDDHYIRNKF